MLNKRETGGLSIKKHRVNPVRPTLKTEQESARPDFVFF
jgi:hypothetical protein